MVWRGLVWPGTARPGAAGRGSAGRGQAGRGRGRACNFVECRPFSYAWILEASGRGRAVTASSGMSQRWHSDPDNLTECPRNLGRTLDPLSGR
jgi:hypothetical protein